jgi:RNA ligase
MKPLGFRNYGSIGHLPCSRTGPKDRSVPQGMADICLSRARDSKDRIFVTEKLDGSNVGVARVGDELLALGRAGYLAETSEYLQHQWFAAWVKDNRGRFMELLADGERCVGEWLAQAHGTRYTLTHEPFVVFDLMEGKQRLPWLVAADRIRLAGFTTPLLLNDGCSPMSVEAALQSAADNSPHGADDIEGAVWRVERDGAFDFMAKFVKHSKVDGGLLPEISGVDAVWNWRPQESVNLP